MSEKDWEEFKTGVFGLQIGKKILNVKPTNSEKISLQAVQRRVAKSDKLDLDENKVTELLEKQDNLVRDMIKRANPTFTDEQIEGIVLTKDTEILEELQVAFGWLTREDVKNFKEKLRNKILSNDEDKT